MKKNTKKVTAKKAPAKKPSKCARKGCTKDTVYMKRNQKTNKMEHWCGKHWREDVEVPQGIAGRETTTRYRRDWEARNPKKTEKSKRSVKKKSEPKEAKKTLTRGKK